MSVSAATPGRRLAFEELKARSAAGGDVGDLVGHAGLLDGGDRVSSANDAGGVLIRGDGLGDRVRTLGEGGHLEDAHRAVPDDGDGVGDLLLEEVDGGWANVESHEVGREGTVAGEDLRLRVGGELVGEDVIDGQQKVDALLLRLGERGLGDVDLVGFDERLAGCLALGVEEGVGHASADDQRGGAIEKAVDDVDLVGDLGSADDRDEGLDRDRRLPC